MIRALVIGAGSPAAVQQFVHALPRACGFAIVIVCPTEAELAARLQPVSPLSVVIAHGRMPLEPDHIYVVPVDCEVSFQRGELLILTASRARRSTVRSALCPMTSAPKVPP